MGINISTGRKATRMKRRLLLTLFRILAILTIMLVNYYNWDPTLRIRGCIENFLA